LLDGLGGSHFQTESAFNHHSVTLGLTSGGPDQICLLVKITTIGFTIQLEFG